MQPLIRQTLQFTNCTNKREDFDSFLQSIAESDYYKFHSKNFKIKLIDYRKTKEHYKELIVAFEEKFKNCLDANFLIDKEINFFKNYLAEGYEPNDYGLGTDLTIKNFRANGFIWVTMGKTILIEDFFLIKDFIYYPKFPVNIADLKECWESAYHDLEIAAKGCAEGLYVQFLKEKKREINNPYYEFEQAVKNSKENFYSQKTEEITDSFFQEIENTKDPIDFSPNTGSKEDFILLINDLLTKEDFIKEFEFYLRNFNVKLSDYLTTKTILTELRESFLNKLYGSLDMNFLIESELRKYTDYENLKGKKYFDIVRNDFIMGKDFVKKGFFWVTTGEEIFIRDFYLLEGKIYEYHKNHFPIKVDSLRSRWFAVCDDIEQAARGCAYGLYVHFLKHFKEKEMNLPGEEKESIKDSTNEQLPETNHTNSKKGLSHKQQILLLDKLGIFERPEIMNLNATQKGKLFSYLLNMDEKNTTEYIRNMGRKKNQVSMDKYFVKTEKNLERVSEILKEIGLEKL